MAGVLSRSGCGKRSRSFGARCGKVDKTAPNPPTASAGREPDYAGNGGWYKDSVTVSFEANGDPNLSDGSAGSGVNLATLSAPQTFDTDGSHTASGTVSDNVGNVSKPAQLTVQVDATAPGLQISCPATALVGSDAVATVTAADEQSGLAQDPSGTVPIDTSTAGERTTTRTAVDNVGHVTEASCTTKVEFSQIVTGAVHGTLTVKSGQAVELTSTASVSGPVKVKSGGELTVAGATLSGPLSANGATALRICGASVAGTVKVANSSGPVVLGDGGSECAASSFYAPVTVKANNDGVSVEGEALSDENVFHSTLKVNENKGGTTVSNNEVHSSLTVKGNEAPVIDTPNNVAGKSKIQ